MIKQPWLLVISGICLVIGIYLVVERSLFLASAEETQGKVISIESRNTTCGSKRRRYACTKFKALVEYPVGANAVPHTILISAGSSRGRDQPVSGADLPEGTPVPVVYAPDNPGKAYQNTFFGVWAAPIIAGIAQFGTLIGSMAQGRRRW